MRSSAVEDEPNVEIEVNIYPGFAAPAIARGVNVTAFLAIALACTAKLISDLTETTN